MENSNKKQTWNRRKGEISNDEELPFSDEYLEDRERELEMVAKAQQRWGVSWEEAKRIIRDSGDY